MPLRRASTRAARISGLGPGAGLSAGAPGAAGAGAAGVAAGLSSFLAWACATVLSARRLLRAIAPPHPNFLSFIFVALLFLPLLCVFLLCSLPFLARKRWPIPAQFPLRIKQKHNREERVFLFSHVHQGENRQKD